ncbi:unnamed protein product [Prunus brigantina]
MPCPRVAADECTFCKEKDHWKSQCPILLNKKSQPQQVFPSKRSPTAAVVSSHCESSASPTVSLIAQQFQKLCSTHQPNALSMISHSSGLPSSSSSGIFPSTWVFDLGATHHMTSDMSLFMFFTSLSSLSTSISILIANVIG